MILLLFRCSFLHLHKIVCTLIAVILQFPVSPLPQKHTYMFFDWLTIEQTFPFQLPLLDGNAFARLVIEQGEVADHLGISGGTFVHRGSYCDSVMIKSNGNTLRMSGNPSRWDRLDNLYGLRTVEQCVAVYNSILRDVYHSASNIPQFTKCTQLFVSQGRQNGDYFTTSDGAIVRELHITENTAVGHGNVCDYLTGLSTQRYRHSIPRLHTNGQSVDWLSQMGNAALIYPTVYNKAFEMLLHSVSKIKKAFGEDSPEFRYLQKIVAFCEAVGLARFELKLKNRYLKSENLSFYGLSDYSKLNDLMTEFLNIDSKLSITAMDFETISERLISAGIVETTRAANTTAMYAIQWMHGHEFDLKKKQVQTHRARLRKIGIDIASRYNVSKISPVFVTQAREVVRSVVAAPEWYQMPQILKIA